MSILQPASVPLLLTVLGLLMVASATLSGPSQRAGIPVVFAFLAIGMIAGMCGVRQVLAQNLLSYFNFGTVALILILFDGGLNTPAGSLSSDVAPAVLLATAGVLLTAVLVALCTLLFNFSWNQALLLGAIVAPTDAAAVFSILHGSGVQLKKRIGTTLELESGLNDPLAIGLTIVATQCLMRHHPLTPSALAVIVIALTGGALAGIAIGYGGRLLLLHSHLAVGGLYPILTIALALLAYGLPALVQGSGFLAVYLSAAIVGSGILPYRAGILRVHDAAAWLCQIVLYLLLGTLVVPSELIALAPAGVALGFFLALVARPISVTVCLLPFRYSFREILYVGWIGLRGAVPIVLAMYPVMFRTDGARRIFNIVFFIVVVNTLIPGATVRWITDWLDLKSGEQTPPPALLEIISARLLTGAEILSFSVNKSAAACGAQISELPFPPGSTVILLIRDNELIPPRGATLLLAGDHVYVLCRDEDRSLVHLLFGRSEED